MKLDAYDKKILEILVSNSREPVTKIAKKVRLKRETVNYKINRLIDAGLIKEFNMILNRKKLGLSQDVVFLELANLQKDTENQILKYLKNNKYMSWIGPAAGRWSMVFDIIRPEKIELDEVIRELLIKFGKYIDDYVILRLQDSDYFTHKFLGIPQPTLKKTQINSTEMRLDFKDYKILSLLNTNAKISCVKISESVSLTPNGISKRIKNLEKTGIILGYTISIDWKKLGYEWYGLQLRQTKFSKEIDAKLVSYFTKNEKITVYNKYLGGQWDYDISTLIKNSGELRDLIHDFRTEFSNEAKITDVFIVLEETTSYKFPKGVFNED